MPYYLSLHKSNGLGSKAMRGPLVGIVLRVRWRVLKSCFG